MSSSENYHHLIIKIESKNSKFVVSAASKMGNTENTLKNPYDNLYFKETLEKINDIIEEATKPSLYNKKELIKFGKHLFSIIFQNDIKELYERLKKNIRNVDGISIKFNVKADELINIPWELLYDNGFLALNKKYPISQCNFEELEKSLLKIYR